MQSRETFQSRTQFQTRKESTHNLAAKLPAQPGAEMPRGNKVHHGRNLGKGKEKGGSKERGRWKGEMTKYGVTSYPSKDDLTSKHTQRGGPNIGLRCAPTDVPELGCR
jgi:hypothetical protein